MSDVKLFAPASLLLRAGEVEKERVVSFIALRGQRVAHFSVTMSAHLWSSIIAIMYQGQLYLPSNTGGIVSSTPTHGSDKACAL